MSSNLEQVVTDWVERSAADYDEGTSGVMRDLTYGGCQSGVVGMLIYYPDTVEFYNEHQQEIDQMLGELCRECGCTPAELFGDKWDDEDPLARDTLNQNLLAGVGFAETASRLYPAH